MQYVLLIYDAETHFASLTPEQTGAMMAEYDALTQDMKKHGHHRGGHPLHPVSTATSVRVRDGKTIVTDGPFAETHEQLGGFYLIEAGDLDTATALAGRIPAARTGVIEVRPVWAIPA